MIKSTVAVHITAIIIAGGLARRMGSVDKALRKLAGKPMIEHVIERIKPQTQAIMINANRNIEQLHRFGYPIVPDIDHSQRGPLLGIYSVLQQSALQMVVTVPCDTPCIPSDLVQRMLAVYQMADVDVDVCLVHDGTRLQPLFALLHQRASRHIADCLTHGCHGVQRCFLGMRHALVQFDDAAIAFCNINTRAELSEMQTKLGMKNEK